MSAPTIDVVAPAEGTVFATIPAQTPDEVREMVAGLRSAQPAWEVLGIKGRVRWLHKWRDWLLDNEAHILALLRRETGKAMAEVPLELGMVIDALNYYTGNAEAFLNAEHPLPHSPLFATKALELNYRPHPVVGVISPWNFPLALALFDAIPALVAGAAVVMKPSSETPLAAQEAVRGWAEIGAPPVFVSAVGNGIGSAVVDTVDFVQFTGSTATGKTVAQQAAKRLTPVGLELGGKDPAIVLADADIAQAAAGVAFGGLSNSGQMCTSIERIYVEDKIYDAFVNKLTEVVASLRQNADSGYDTDIGAMVTESQVKVATDQIADAVAKGAKVLTGGKGSGYFFEPTVLIDVDHMMTVMTEETFGPVLPVMRVKNAEEAIALANDSEYGLSASVWTRDYKRGKEISRRLEVGSVDINDASAHLACFPLPQSGWKESGVGGRLGGAYGIRKFCRTNAITTPRIEVSVVSALLWFPYSKRKAEIVTRTFRFLGARSIRQRLGI